MKTWQIKANNRIISVKALKASAEGLEHAIRSVSQVPQTVRELNWRDRRKRKLLHPVLAVRP